MSWHNRDCGIPDLSLSSGYPTCVRCGSSAFSIAGGAKETAPPPAPPPCPKRSQLTCSWPPCVKYSEYCIDEEGNDLTEFIIENIDAWNIDATDLPGDRANLQEGRGGSQQTDGSSGAPKLSRVYSNTTYFGASIRLAETRDDKPNTDALGPTSTPRSDRIHENLCGSDDFRLLRLYGSASFDEPIHCSLEIAQLDDPDGPLYEALSYTWADLDGDKRNCMPIYIGSHFDVLLVTKNCELALRRLRKSTDRLLWIDAVCINQNDSRERSRQVSHMAEIYSRAPRVRVYLGEESSSSGEALHIAAAYSRNSIPEKHRASLVELSKRPYFKRLWIIQEVALAIKVSVTCGISTIHWTDLCSALQSCEAAPAWIKHFTAPRHERRKTPSVLQLLQDTKDSLCVDPRDKLFGIIGLACTAEREMLPTDYSLSTQELYTGLAAYWIQETDNRNFLNIAANQRKFIPGLPSWVPDWTNIETQESGTMTPELLVRSPYAAFPHLFWRHDDEPNIQGGSLNTCMEWRYGDSYGVTLLRSRPIIQHTVGALLIYAVPLFKLSCGELRTNGVANEMRITNWRVHRNYKFFSNTENLEIFVIPSCQQIFILKKHGAGIWSLQGTISMVLDHLESEEVLSELSAQGIPSIDTHETNDLERWFRVVLGLHLSSKIASQNSAVGQPTSNTAVFPDLPGLRDTEESLRGNYQESDQIGFNMRHLNAMDLMRTIMVNAIDPEDLAWHFPKPSRAGPNMRWSAFGILLEEVESFAEELPARSKSVEEQINTWFSSVVQLKSQLQEQGSFADAFRDLQDDKIFDPIFWVLNSPQINEGYEWDVLLKVLGNPGDSREIHLSLILQKAYSVISRATLDENLPWDFNRDRFWMCVVSFDLIVRLRLLLADRQLYAHVERSISSSIANPKRIVII